MNTLSLLPPPFTRLICACIVLLFVVSACTKHQHTPDLRTRGASLKITLTSIEDAIPANNAKAKAFRSTADHKSHRERSITSEEGIVSLGAMDALLSTYDLPQNNDLANSPANAAKQQHKQQSTATPQSKKMSISKMTSGVYYRLIMYDQANTQVVNQIIASGSNPVIQVDGSRDYRWYALSVNESNPAVPTMNGAGIVARASLLNKDVLYAAGLISTVDGDNYLDIQFKRKTARTQVRLNVRGLFGTINDGTQISLVKGPQNSPFTSMGDFNMFTENFSNIAASSSVVTAANMTPVTDEPNNTVKLANFYTIDDQPIAENQLKIVTNRIDIRLDDNRDRIFNNSSTIAYQQAHTPAIGSSLALRLRLIESPVKVKGIYWARSNIIYNPDKVDRYRLKSNPGGSTPATRDTEFWNWMAQTPNGPTSNVDVCARLYPENTWRMPTSAEWQSMESPNRRREVLGLFFGAQYAYIWNRDNDYPANPAYDDNDLFLSFGGYRTTSNFVLQSPAGILIGLFATGECHYWTSTENSSDRAIAAQSAFTRFVWGFSWGAVTYPNRYKSEGRNIRCVRQVINN